MVILSKTDLVDEAIHMCCNSLFTHVLCKTGLLRDARNDQPSLFELWPASGPARRSLGVEGFCAQVILVLRGCRLKYFYDN